MNIGLIPIIFYLDGTPHLHIAVWLKKKLSCNEKFFDCVCEKHGNYLAMRSGYGSVNYLRKVGVTRVT